MAKATAEKTTAQIAAFPGFDLAKAEIPAAVRDLGDKAAAQLKDGYAKAKAAAQEAGDVAEDAYKSLAKGVNAFNLAAIEAGRANVIAGFDHARDLLGAKTLAEVVELQTAYVRARFEAAQTQVKSLAGIVQETATETGAPVKAAAEKLFAKAS